MRKNIAGGRIKIAREETFTETKSGKKKRLTQEMLAARMQIEGHEMNTRQVSRIELGQAKLPDVQLVAFAKILGKTVAWLVGEE